MKFEPVINWRSDLFAEKSLLQVYLRANRIVGSETDKRIAFWFAALLSATVILGRALFSEFNNPALSIYLARGWAELGVTLASSILGFLIAGFAIFATATKTSHLQRLAAVKRVDRDFSQLKFIYFNFLYIFVHYGAFLTLCIAVFVGLQAGTPIWATGDILHRCVPIFVDIGAALVCVALATYFVFALLLIKSFIWNLYQALLFTIAIEPDAAPASAPPQISEQTTNSTVD